MSKKLFPEPKYKEFQDGHFELVGDVDIVLPHKADFLELHALEDLSLAIRSMGGNSVNITEVPKGNKSIFVSKGSDKTAWKGCTALRYHPLGSCREGYFLNVSDGGIYLSGDDSAGVFYACKTLEALLERRDGRLVIPQVKIRDFPDYRYRGLYIEDKWGSDLMTLDDWKHLVDFMSEIKLNFLGVGVYGCWCIQHYNKITEFLMLPLENYPRLSTPQTIT